MRSYQVEKNSKLPFFNKTFFNLYLYIWISEWYLFSKKGIKRVILGQWEQMRWKAKFYKSSYFGGRCWVAFCFKMVEFISPVQQQWLISLLSVCQEQTGIKLCRLNEYGTFPVLHQCPTLCIRNNTYELSLIGQKQFFLALKVRVQRYNKSGYLVGNTLVISVFM